MAEEKNKVLDTQNALPTIRNWVKNRISETEKSIVGESTDPVNTLTLNGLNNKFDKKVGDLDSSVAASEGQALSGITIEDGKITGHTEMNFDSSVAAKTGNVLTGITITNGKISDHTEANLDSSVKAAEGQALTSITIEDGKITGHSEMNFDSSVSAKTGHVLTGITIEDGKISDHTEMDLDSSVKASDGNVLTGITIVNGKITGHTEHSVTNLYRFKGNVATEADLPTEGNIGGDVYNIEARSSYGMEGMNVGWVADSSRAEGGYWDKLGSGLQIDYATATEVNDILNETTSETTTG